MCHASVGHPSQHPRVPSARRASSAGWIRRFGNRTERYYSSLVSGRWRWMAWGWHCIPQASGRGGSCRTIVSFSFGRLSSATRSWRGSTRSQSVDSFYKRSPKLRSLDLSEIAYLIDWRPHLQGIFEALETHTSLRKFVVKDRTWKQLHYTWLAQLLTRNRNITVLNDKGRICSNGSPIDKIYVDRRLQRNALTSQPGVIDLPGSSSSESQPIQPRKRKTRMQ